MMMYQILSVLSCLLIVLSCLPFIRHPHWFFRVPEFLKLQFLVLQALVFPLTFMLMKDHPWLWAVQILQLGLMVHHLYILMRYTKFWKAEKFEETGSASAPIKIVSCNVYQFNTQHTRFVELIRREKPDIFLTMESNGDWERAMRVLENDYPFHEKVTLENTYGMHFFTRLKVVKSQVHYFVAEDLPSIEVELETQDGQRFVFFGVHPPPPSPTEEDNSKERDGDLLSVAKKVRNYKMPVLVTGDFNNVAWARSSILFKKTSRLIDARIGRGILATFHANYWFFRVPLDLLFHSPDIFIDELSIYPSIGSDHFPMGCTFHIDKRAEGQEEELVHLEEGEMQEVNELIEEGMEEESENR